MWDDARLDAELPQALPAALGVHDDPVEPTEEAPPQVALPRRPPREQIVCGEHGRAAEAKPNVQLGECEPLHVEDVGAHAAERGRDPEVLGGLEGETGG